MSHLWQFLETQVRTLCATYGYQEIRTPLFETTNLFTRSIGTTSDIVKKEMYTFQDKAGRSLTLRPEGTAPVMRAFIEKNLDQKGPVHKFFYLYPMFRYERQQAGRYRQHHQFGVEAIGAATPYQDVEVIHLLWSFYAKLGLKGLTLHLNSIGDAEARQHFRHALKMYLRPHLNALSAESQERYATNPLRILDSKNPQDQKLLAQAPSILDSLSGASRSHFDHVCALLEAENIPFNLNSKLVRGLDYYNSTVFEITSNELGAQNSLGGGGRYDGLISQLGGPDLPAFGFGAGLERIIQAMLAQKVALPSPYAPLLFIIPLGEKAEKHCFQLLNQIRAHDLPAEMDLTGKKLKQAMRYADASGARFVTVIGENELESNTIELKEMSSGTQQSIPLNRLIDALQKNA
ncbi:MAG: Histidine--tRNA ligase [Chlamydiales bacterium]|nr:Histidine--tRNA ligase [Chlamydiales bacterium]